MVYSDSINSEGHPESAAVAPFGSDWFSGQWKIVQRFNGSVVQ
jgi:hypothetical protein